MGILAEKPQLWELLRVSGSFMGILWECLQHGCTSIVITQKVLPVHWSLLISPRIKRLREAFHGHTPLLGKYGVDGISFRLCPGLKDIRQDEADIVVIAGMSGETILSILDDAGWDWTSKQLILEANTKHPELLIWLYQHKLHIEEEKMPLNMSLATR